MIFLEISRESEGRHTLVDVFLIQGGGNPTHFHDRFAEELTCLDGELCLQIDKQTIRLKPGESATAPAHSQHRFFNQSGELCRFRADVHPVLPALSKLCKFRTGWLAMEKPPGGECLKTRTHWVS